MAKKEKWLATLSTTEPYNHIGLIQVRQSNKNSETWYIPITQNGESFDMTDDGITEVFFCTKFLGKYPVEQRATIVDAKKGHIKYTMSQPDMQIPGIQQAYFKFVDKNGNYQGSTQSFSYKVIQSIEGSCAESGTYIVRLEELFQLYHDYMNQQMGDWESFFNAYREIIESIDPGGVVLKEIVEARKPENKPAFPNLASRLNQNDKTVDRHDIDLEIIKRSMVNEQGIIVDKFKRVDDVDNETTDYYITKIDMSNKMNKIKTAIERPEITVRDFAYKNNQGYVINAAATIDNAGLIVDKKVINPGTEIGSNTERDLLCVLEDGTLTSYPMNHLPSDDELLSVGVVDSFAGFWTLVKNNKFITHKDSNDWSSNWLTKYQRQMIGQKPNKDLVVLTSDGKRTSANRNYGLTAKEAAEILKNTYGCTFVYMLDGGGSTSLVYDQIFINQPSDDYFLTQRKRPHFMYIENEMIKNTRPILEMKNNISDINDKAKSVRMIDAFHNAKEVSELGLINNNNNGSVTFKGYWDHGTDKETNARMNFYKRAFEIIYTDETGKNNSLMYVSLDQLEGVFALRGSRRYTPPEILNQRTTNFDNVYGNDDFLFVGNGAFGLNKDTLYRIECRSGKSAAGTEYCFHTAYPASASLPALQRSSINRGGWSSFYSLGGK